MSREFSRSFYHSHAWLKNRLSYLSTPVDLDGHRLYMRYQGDSIEPEYYYVNEYGHEVTVDPDWVVPPGLCERCFARGVYTPAKPVHHIIHLTPENVNDPEISLSFDNLMRLCQDCHAAVHAGTDESRVSFDEFGNVVWKED